MFPCQTRYGCPKGREEPGSKKFCPLWFEKHAGFEFRERNVRTGEERATKGCIAQILPGILHYTVQFQNQTVSEVSEARKDTVREVRQAVRQEAQAVMLDLVGAMPTLLASAVNGGALPHHPQQALEAPEDEEPCRNDAM